MVALDHDGVVQADQDDGFRRGADDRPTIARAAQRLVFLVSPDRASEHGWRQYGGGTGGRLRLLTLEEVGDQTSENAPVFRLRQPAK